MAWRGRRGSRTHEDASELRATRDADGAVVFHVGGGGSRRARYEVRRGVPVDAADLPVHDVSRMLLDGVLVDLSESRVERPGTDHVTFIVPVDESPVPGVPVRIGLDAGVHDVVLDGDDGLDTEPATVDRFTHHGDGRFTVSYFDGTLTFTAETFTVGVEELSLRRPPYLRVEPTEGTDGLVDVATGDPVLASEVDLDEIELPDDLKARLRRSGEIYLRGRYGPEFDVEQDAIRAAVAEALPDSVVS